jgi:prepilin-type N-terminal cleavage/methylation domain-containing protein/prepilin-type processing-associated H-X9-DG protein
MYRMRAARPLRAFTLIELLVVIAIIAILAAILFPVFAKARDRAKSAGGLSNLKQMGISAPMYVDDYDGMLVPYGIAINLPGGGYDSSRFTKLLEPYTKNTEIFTCPSDHLNRARLRQMATTAPYPTTYGVNWYICRETGSYWNTPGRPEKFVKQPAGTIWAADTAVIDPLTKDKPADQWKELLSAAKEADIYFFYLPNEPNTGAPLTDGWSTPNFQGRLVRPFGRHMGRANCMFFDGHAAAVPASQFDPKVTPWGSSGCLWDNPQK